MPPVDDGTESVCSCCFSHYCWWRQLTDIFQEFIFSTPFPACTLVCLPGVITPSVLSTFWELSVQHLTALLCNIYAHLWQTDWRDTNVTNWPVTSWPCGPTKYRIGHIGRIGTQSIACCSGVGAARHQGAPAYPIKCSGSCLYNYTGLFCLVKINADIHSFIVSC